MTPSAYLRAAGEALYGARWQAEFAAALGVSRQHLVRLMTGARAVQPQHTERARELLRQRGIRIRDLLAA